MSNYLALATVTSTLSQLVQEAINGTMLPTVTHLRPDGSGLPSPGVNIFLYQVTPNAAWRNVDLPARNSDGKLVTRPKVALDLHYLLTFYGDESALEPQRLLGLAVAGIHSKPILTRQQIAQAVADPANPYLDGSDLDQEVELVKFTPLPLSLEELSKLWSVFFQTHYSLSIAYHATVVLLVSTKVPVSTLPARTRNYYTIPYYSIDVDRIANDADASAPIVMDSVLAITGRGLEGETTRVRVAGVDLTPTSIADARLTVSLADLPDDAQRAGVQGLQVVHELPMGSPDTPTMHRAVESSIVPFVLSPRFQKKEDHPELGEEDTFNPITVSWDVLNTEATIAMKVLPRITKEQRVQVLLNQNTDTNAASFTYTLNMHDLIVDPDTDTDTLTLTLLAEDTPSGNYLLRVRVDGAETALEFSGGVYSGPIVSLAP
jgi:hypothetical protein